jgi:hypothetical protein
MLSETGRAELLDRGRSAGFPELRSTTGGAFHVAAGESAWLLFCQRSTVAEAREVADILAARAAREAREADEDDRRARGLVYDEALARETAAEAEALLERSRAERPQRIEALLGRCADALEQLLVKRGA